MLELVLKINDLEALTVLFVPSENVQSRYKPLKSKLSPTYWFVFVCESLIDVNKTGSGGLFKIKYAAAAPPNIRTVITQAIILYKDFGGFTLNFFKPLLIEKSKLF